MARRMSELTGKGYPYLAAESGGALDEGAVPVVDEERVGSHPARNVEVEVTVAIGIEPRRPGSLKLVGDPETGVDEVDTGAAKNRAGANPEPSRLTGIGLGLIWSLSPKYFAELYFADGRTSLPEQPGHSLQDDGVHFRFVAFPMRP